MSSGGGSLTFPDLAAASVVARTDVTTEVRALQRSFSAVQIEIAAAPPADIADWASFDSLCAATIGEIVKLESETQTSIANVLTFFKADADTISEFLPRMAAFISEFSAACAKHVDEK